MASKAIANPFFRYVAKRNYAQALPALKESKISCTVLPNQTFVAALDNGSPVTRVTIAFKAGSRYESPNEIGVAHILRCAAGLTTSNASAFITARKLAQIGASVTASGDREFIYYTLETTQSNLNEAIECLNNMVSCQEFRPWELDDITPRLKYDIASLPPQVRAIDLLHKAAFRRGLGNSLYISPKRIGKISSEAVQHFAGGAATPARCAVAIVGDSQDKAQLIAQALRPSASNAQVNEVPSKYYSGELRKEMGGDLAHIALAGLGAPAGSGEALALAIAAKALGNGPSCKWGSDNTPLGRAVGNIGPYAAAGFSAAYSDAGLFGVVLTVPKDESLQATKAVAGVLKSGNLDGNAIKAGRAQLKLQVLSEAEYGTNLAESVAAQGLYSRNVKAPADLARDIDSVSDAQVCSAMSAAMKSGLSMGAAGNLSSTPYVDEL